MEVFKYCFLFVAGLSWTCAFHLQSEKADLPSERVHLQSVSERSEDGSRTLHLSAFGESHVLHLKPAEIFTPDFKLIQVNQDLNGNTQFNEIKENEMEEPTESGHLYSVNDGQGSLYISEAGELQAEGVINEKLRITPNVKDYQEDGSLAHTVHQMRSMDYNNHRDFIIPEPGQNIVEESQNFLAEDVPSEVTVEVLVVFDHANSKRLDFDLTKIRKYVAIFWSQIHYRYRDTSKPKINIAVSGLLTFNKPQDEPYIFKYRYGEDQVDKECLSAFREWLEKSKASLPKHDVALLQLGLDAGIMTNGKWDSSYAGLAYVGTACSTTGYNSGFAEDVARTFSGFNGVAHELAHILDAPHDGEEAATACPTEQGFVMSGGWKKTFSKCSIEIMRKYVSSDKGKCLRDAPNVAVRLIDLWPVLMIEDLNEQCRLLFRNNDYYFPKKISEDFCKNIWCGKKNTDSHWTPGGALEGTPCAFNKVCLDSKCVYRPAPTLDQQCQQQFGTQFKATTNQNICKEVRCSDSKTGKQQSLGRPFPGTPCGTKNFCLNGECYAA